MLLFLGKADLVHKDNRKVIRTINGQYPWPSIIRLSRYINVPYRQVILTRKNILRRDSFRCAYCGRSDVPLTIDHIIPKSQGGKDTWENLITACTYCNNKKGDRTPSEANMKILTKPYKPNHIIFIKNSVSKIDESWKPFLYLT